MRRTRRWLVLGALVSALGLAAAACGGGGTNVSSGAGFLGNVSGSANTANSGTPAKGGTVTHTIEKNITNWNPETADGNTFDFIQVLNMIYPNLFLYLPDVSVKLNTDILVSATQTNTSPETIVYKIQPNAVWSDGVPINADDWVYQWYTQDGTHCPDCSAASNTGYNLVKSVDGSDNGKTVTVVFDKPFGDWQSLFFNLLPAHVAVKDAGAASVTAMTPKQLAQTFNTTFDSKPPTVSGGPYVLSNWADNTAATLTPNPKYYGKAPPLDKLVFRVITDAAVEPTALRNHEVDGIFPQPQVDLLNNVKAIPSIKYQLAPGLQYEHFDLNLKNPFLADKAIRQAIFTAVNVKEIISKTVGQFDPQIKPILSRMYVPSQSGYEDNVTAYGLGSGDLAKAKQILTSAGYKIQGNSLVNPQGQTVPDFTMRYTVGNAIRQTQCQLLAAAVAPLGIKVNVQSTTSLGKTLTHKANLDYDIVVFAWVDTPFPNSGNNPLYVTGGGSNYGSYTSKEVDDLMNGALSSLDPALIKTNLNKADKILSQDAYTLPLYQKPVLIAYYPNVVNMRLNGTSEGPSYNGGEWGLRKVT